MWVEFVFGFHLAPIIFLRVLRFSSLHKNRHLQIPVPSGSKTRMKTSKGRCGFPSEYCNLLFIYLFIYWLIYWFIDLFILFMYLFIYLSVIINACILAMFTVVLFPAILPDNIRVARLLLLDSERCSCRWLGCNPWPYAAPCRAEDALKAQSWRHTTFASFVSLSSSHSVSHCPFE